jgi:hypothetical protein
MKKEKKKIDTIKIYLNVDFFFLAHGRFVINLDNEGRMWKRLI